MTLPVEINPLLLGSNQGYQISRSVRLRSSASAFFSRTPASAGSRKTWTWSGWVKRGALGTAQSLFSAGLISGTFNYTRLFFDASDRLVYAHYPDALSGWLTTTQVFRDPSAWYHIVAVFNSPDATAANRMQLYVNGSQITSFTAGSFSTTYPSQNTDSFVNNSSFAANIGRNVNGGTAETFDGYLTEINFIDGQALTPAAFGETNPVTGVWQPKKYAGTYGTNGFYLPFSDNSAATATTIGADRSGNGNNWTPNNISLTLGATYDSMVDVPTNWADGGNGRGNYCTLNPLNYNSAATLSNANLQLGAPATAVNYPAGSTFALSSGKWYFEATLTTVGGNFPFVGIGYSTNNFVGSTSSIASFTGTLWAGNGGIAAGDVIGLAIDLDALTFTAYKNNVIMTVASGFVASNTIPAGQTWVPCVSALNNGAWNLNFGQRPFAYTPPTGFRALNTNNLPEPLISNGRRWMDATAYTSNGTTQSIVNSGFQPDLVWTKARSSASNHVLNDSVRGAANTLGANTTSAESSSLTYLTSFDASGYTIGTGNFFGSGTTMIGWQWKRGAQAGFDIVTYTGTGANRTVAHSLGVAPRMIIIKRRDAAVNWFVGHASLASWASVLEGLNTTSAANNAATGVFNSTAPTSSVFSLGTEPNVNGSGGTFVAYLFAEVPGFSRFGSYTGNGSTDGSFVWCGFRPRWVMVKRTDVADAWLVLDTARLGYNGGNVALVPNTSGAEGSTSYIDVLSNGFKARQSNTEINASGGTYIFAAFAENPFKYSLAR